MEQLQQFEVWAQSGDTGKWDLVASFAEFDAARAVAATRPNRVRLVHVTYQNGQVAESQVLAEVGSTREKP